MKRFPFASSILIIFVSILFFTPATVRASEGEGGHGLETVVNGYHVTLASQNEWVKGDNVLVVTITDGMGMPVGDADVQVLVAPREDGHGEPETDAHDGGQEETMPGMGTGEGQSEEPSMTGMGETTQPSVEVGVHEEEVAGPVTMTESEHGVYTVQSHLESSGEYDVHVLFHVNGEMLEADFVVDVAGSSSKAVVLWSYAAVNIAIVTAAGTLRKQKSLTVKTGK